LPIVIFYSTKRIQSFIPSWIATSLGFIGFIWVDRRCVPATVDLAPTETIQAWNEETIDAGGAFWGIARNHLLKTKVKEIPTYLPRTLC
jgi:hypothetical protein